MTVRERRRQESAGVATITHCFRPNGRFWGNRFVQERERMERAVGRPLAIGNHIRLGPYVVLQFTVTDRD